MPVRLTPLVPFRRPAPVAQSRLRRTFHLGKRALFGIGRRLRRLFRPMGDRPFRYENWIKDRIVERQSEYPLGVEAGLISILTPIFNPASQFLQCLAESILRQDYRDWEWVIVLNGPQSQANRRLIGRLARDARVRVLSNENNVGIIQGTRLALEQAKGRFVVPVDHDDCIYPDALRVLAYFIHQFPTALSFYSDEDKLIRDEPACPYFKPAWDPALFLNCCYVSHLSAFHRETALELGAYTDSDAEGCPDWDTHCRFVRAGHAPHHIPEVLYSWRVHPASTSTIESGAKTHAVQCQEMVLHKHLLQSETHALDELQSNECFGHPGMWRVSRRQVEPQPIVVNVVSNGNVDALIPCLNALARTDYPRLSVRVIGTLGRTALEALPSEFAFDFSPWRGRYAAWLEADVVIRDDDAIIATLCSDFAIEAPDWAWEALGMLERHADAACVTGQFRDDRGELLAAGEVFGYAGLTGSPIVHSQPRPSGYHGLLYCQRTVSVPTPWFFVARAGFIKAALAACSCSPSFEMLGCWLGAYARQSGQRILYSPFIRCRRRTAHLPLRISDAEVLHFLRQHRTLLEHDPTYGRFFSLKREEGYHLTESAQRERRLRETICRVRTERRPVEVCV